MSDRRKQEEGNPEMVHVEKQGIPAGGRQSVPDAKAISPGKPDAPGARPNLEPQGPVVERRADRGAPEKKK